MMRRHAHHLGWLLAWVVLALVGTLALARLELAQQREAFETDARIAHRLLSQRAVQLDAVLAMLSILQPADDASQSERLLPAIYPHILRVQRLGPGADWPSPELRAAAHVSRAERRPALAGFDATRGLYQLVLNAQPASYLIQVDLRGLVPAQEWPMAPGGKIRVALDHDGQSFEIEPGLITRRGWPFEFRKHLATPSQPFDLVAARSVGWSELPWLESGAWALASAVLVAVLAALQQQRQARRRAEELLRLGQIARLNTMGELAAGMAHELNQPLTAILANTQAASRLLDEAEHAAEPATDETRADIRNAMQHAAAQARRAADVIARLRRMLERPDSDARVEPLDLAAATQNVLGLLEPECRRLHVVPRLAKPQGDVLVSAEPVALEQVIHNLLCNALQALEQVPPEQRSLELTVTIEGGKGVLQVRDNGPGIPADVLPRIFEPFFTTRQGGLGLGLNLCETLAAHMGGKVAARNGEPRGALFLLSLPQVSPAGLMPGVPQAGTAA